MQLRSYSFYAGSLEAERNLFTLYRLSHLFIILIHTHLRIYILQMLHLNT